MMQAHLDVSIRLAAVTTILLLALLLFRNRRDVGTPALLFAPLAICLSGFLAGNTPDAALRLFGAAGEAARVASGFAVIFLWWFCLACFDRRFRPGGGVLAVGLAWAVVATLDRGLLGPAFAEAGLSYGLLVLGFAIVGHLVWRLSTEWNGDLIEQRRDARIMVAILLGGLLFVDLSVDLVFGFAWRPPAFAMAQNAAILGFGLWLAAKLLAVRPGILTFAAPAGRTAPPPTGGGTADERLHRRLTALIDGDRIFLDPDLTFAAFVARMGAPERVVRTLINRDLGFDHFRTFLNHHRMAEARRLLGDPGRRGDKLIVIALDSGFASLASFNRVFLASEGCSPSRFRDADDMPESLCPPGNE